MTDEVPQDRAEPEPASSEVTSRMRRFALPAGIVALAAASTTWLDVIARHSTSSNSDSATVVLEGQAMNAGHILLSGWALSLDSFWTVDVPFYAAAVRVVGLRRDLIYTVPAVIAALVFLVVALMATRSRPGAAALVGVVVVAIPLLAPARPFAIFFLQGPFHVATTLWALLAFWLISNSRFDWRWLLAVLFLVAGALGDFQATALGMVPIFLVGLVAADVGRSWRRALPMLSAPITALAAYLAIRQIARQLGSFSIARANSIASWHQRVRNLSHLPRFLVGLAGIGTKTFGATGVSTTVQNLGAIRLLLFVGGPLVMLVALGRRLPAARRSNGGLSSEELLDSMVTLAFFVDLGMFVLLPLTNSPAYGRYLSAAIILGTLLAARLVTRGVAASSRRVTRVAVVLSIALAGLFAYGVVDETHGHPAYQPAATLAAFLQSEHLTNGVGDYWSASITTLESDGAVHVRPVIAVGGHLVRYEKNSARAWYEHQRFNFFVYEPTAIWNGDTERAATRDWGAPSRIWRIGPYKVVVFAHTFRVAVTGWIGPRDDRRRRATARLDRDDLVRTAP